MAKARGFTLIETVIATGILAVGSLAVASLFISTVEANVNNGRTTIAGILLSDKIERLAVIPFSDNRSASGGSVRGDALVTGYFDYAGIGPNNAIVRSDSDETLPYLRLWEISESVTKSLTVVVLANPKREGKRPMELARTTTVISARW
jgi:prepilin-type N-terminal cleavage/methylation domain-containing protein